MAKILRTSVLSPSKGRSKWSQETPGFAYRFCELAPQTQSTTQGANGFRTPALTEAPHPKRLLSFVSKSAEVFRIASEECMNEERPILIASDSGIAIRSFGDISDALGICLG